MPPRGRKKERFLPLYEHIVEIGTVEDIFDRTGHPYTKGLFTSLPGFDESSKRLKPKSRPWCSARSATCPVCSAG